MNRILYSDLNGKYTLLDYNRSHGELLLRKRVNAGNTDILFKYVQSIFLSFELNGIEISIVEEESELSLLKENYFFSTEYGYRIYSIRTKDNKNFYVNGGVFGVFSNELDILESSVGDFTGTTSNKLIFWSESK
jgi:hypothetical protein